jgi:hypothetical protein
MYGFELLKDPKHKPIGKMSNEAMLRYLELARHLVFMGKNSEAIEILETLGYESKNIKKFIKWLKKVVKTEENKNIVRIFKGKIGNDCLQ